MSISNEVLLQAVKDFGTPLYIYDGDMVVQRYKELYDFIPWPKLKIHYAMKSNYNFELLKLLNDANASLDTVSPAEIMLALKAGFSKDRIIYTANNMTEEEVDCVQSLGVLMNLGSLSRLEKYGKKYPRSKICLRFNPDVVDGEHASLMTGGDLTKFGILLQDVDKVKEIIKKYDLTVVGIHEHTGSGLQKTESVFQSMKNVLKIATKDNFPDLEFVDFGGGFKVPYKPDEERVDYAAMGAEIVKIFSDFCKEYGKELAMYFEPGKYIVAESGYMLVEVNTIKDNNGRKIVGCNSGFPQLIRPMFYDAYHHIVNLSNQNGIEGEFDICGNICETGDRFAEARVINEIREGDILSIENAGAYCYSMGSVYNLRAMPAEAVYHNGEMKLVRRRLTNEQLIEQILGEVEV
ncbi:diaminopimelate decarboxylase [Lentisphaerota bacterium WC36G]|nr:diaminopimelate decarboxylase [Lentisphaerae bacterium WC36]